MKIKGERLQTTNIRSEIGNITTDTAVIKNNTSILQITLHS